MGDHDHKQQEQTKAALNELINFIDPATRKDILESSLNLLLSLSTNENFREIISSNQQTDLYKRCGILYPSSTGSSKVLLLSIFVNMTSNNQSNEIVLNLLKSNALFADCLEKCLQSSDECVEVIRAAQLLSNLSRIFPHRLAEELSFQNSEFLSKLFDRIFDPKIKIHEKNSANTYLGFLFVNLSTVQSISIQLAKDKLSSIIAMLPSNSTKFDGNSKQIVALETIYNLSLRDELHESLLADERTQDSLLTALLGPLADMDDQLDEEEMEKLPIELQYWEGRRVEDRRIWQRILSILYQLCATRLGREVLRQKGIYALLRELDKARGRQKEEEGMMAVGRMILVENGNGSDVLRALIGILIRTEEDMGLMEGEEKDKLASIRQLGLEEERKDE